MMNRRVFLKASLVGVGLVGVSAAGWVMVGPDNQGPRTVDELLTLLDTMQNQSLISAGQWNVAQVMDHCAQSVEFSLLGFPEHKSDVFKNTAGAVAFSLFGAKGSMKHGLSEAIPGAPELDANRSIAQALARLKRSLIEFDGYNGQLKDHFAYGALNKDDYALAHVMHFNNHMQLITVA